MEHTRNATTPETVAPQEKQEELFEGYEVHPAAAIFPLMEGDELQALAADIKKHGLREPIVYMKTFVRARPCDGSPGFCEETPGITITDYVNQILDGRNRLRACGIAGVSPVFKKWKGEGSPTDFILSRNLHRRHLSESQRSMIAATDLVPIYAREAKARQLAALHGISSASGDAHGKAAAKAAKAVGVSPSSVERAIQLVKQGDPAVIEKVKQGKLTVGAATKHESRFGKEHRNRRGWYTPQHPRDAAEFYFKKWGAERCRNLAEELLAVIQKNGPKPQPEAVPMLQ